MKTPEQWAKEFVKAGSRAVTNTLEKTMEKQLEAIGVRAGRSFHVTGTTGTGKKGKRTGFKFTKKNLSGHLRIRTGDLYRSIIARGGRNSDSIRKVTTKRFIVTGEIGTTVENNGFSYPYFHEFGRFPFLTPARNAEQSRFYSRFNKEWRKVKL